MDCPGGHHGVLGLPRLYVASTLVLMDCPGGHLDVKAGLHLVGASTLVLMDCPGGLEERWPSRVTALLQPLF